MPRAEPKDANLSRFVRAGGEIVLGLFPHAETLRSPRTDCVPSPVKVTGLAGSSTDEKAPRAPEVRPHGLP